MPWELRQGRTEANSKRLFAGIGLLEKFRQIPSTVIPADWLFVDAFQALPLRKQEGRAMQWATIHRLRQLCTLVKTRQDWEVLALAALSYARGLRASEAITAALDEETLHFRGAKGRRGMQHETMGPWARKWGDFLARLQALSGHHLHRLAFITSKAHLKGLFSILLQAEGCCCQTIRWHSWRRFGVAQFQCLGVPLHLIQIWGGWRSPAVARMYATPPPSWMFQRDGPMPVPKWKEEGPTWYELQWPTFAIFTQWI